MKEWLLKKRRRIILAGILITAAPLLGLAVFVNYQVISALEDRLVKETGWFADIAGSHIEDRLQGDINLGNIFVTRQYLLSGLRRGDKHEMSKQLKNLVDNHPMLDRAFIASGKGVLLAAYTEDPSTVGKNFSDRDWYKGVSKNWAPYVSDFYLRAGRPRRHIFAIAIPMRLKGKVKGILVMQPKPGYIKEALSGIGIGSGHMQVVDRKGNLVHHSEYDIDGIMPFTGCPVVPKVLEGMKGVEKIIDPEYKKPFITAYRPVAGWGWGVMVNKPVHVVLAPVRKITFSLAGFTGLMLLIGGFLAYYGAGLLISRKALSEERARIFNYSLDMLCIAGFDGYFKELNPAWTKTLGWTPEELKAKPFIEFTHPEDRAPTIQAAGSLSEGKAVTTFDNRYLCKDGLYKWLSWSSYPILEEKLIFAVARDITERKKLEQAIMERSAQLEDANHELQAMNEEQQVMNEELQVQQKELVEMNIRLQEVSRAKSDFLANMSHELRTPLNSVIGFSEILQDELYGKLNEKQKEYMNDILGSGRHLLALINDILDLSKVEAGKMEIELSAVPLRNVIETALSLFREKAVKHNISLGCEIEPACDREIIADERKLKQIMFNLVSNAVKFTPDGGSVSVRVAARRVQSSEFKVQSKDQNYELRTMNSELDGDFIEISVSDTGIGISPENLSKLFKEFSQFESPYTKNHEGAGLGLALTKKLVELHHGMIRAESTFGKGSTFSFTLPLMQSRHAGGPLLEAKKSVQAKSGTRRALLIDDDPKTVGIVETALAAEGFLVLKASDAGEGIRIARAEAPDLIVLDLMMPGMDGFEAAEILKSDGRTTEIPVVVLTAMELSTAERKRLEGTADLIAGKGGLTREGFIHEIRKCCSG